MYSVQEDTAFCDSDRGRSFLHAICTEMLAQSRGVNRYESP